MQFEFLVIHVLSELIQLCHS